LSVENMDNTGRWKKWRCSLSSPAERRARGAHASSCPPIKTPNPIGRNICFWLMDKDHEALWPPRKGAL
jgi:hypothetical protein